MMKDRSNSYAKGGITGIAMVPFFLRHGAGTGRLAIRTFRSAMPSNLFKVSEAIIVGGKNVVNFGDAHVSTSLWDNYKTSRKPCQEKSSTLKKDIPKKINIGTIGSADQDLHHKCRMSLQR